MSRVQLPTPTSGGRVRPWSNAREEVSHVARETYVEQMVMADVHMCVTCCASTGKKGKWLKIRTNVCVVVS